VHHVYIVECNDGSFYTGYTTDVGRRVAEHNAGRGAKYTLGRRPVELVYEESFESQSAAMSREYEIKQLSRREKERLVAGAGETSPENSSVADRVRHEAPTD
jgi:putative endonuclease